MTDTLVHLVRESAWLAAPAALLGGLLTAANPCVIAMVPLMIGFVAGQETHRSVSRSLLLSLTFWLGLTAMFFLLFGAAMAAQSLLRAGWWVYIAAVVCLLMGLHLLGILDIRIPAPRGFTPSRRGVLGALLLGLLFGLVSLPCAGPILAALLALLPLKGAAYGSMLLVCYSLGHCALIIVGGTSMGFVQRLIDSKGMQRANIWFKRSTGVLILGVGLYLLVWG